MLTKNNPSIRTLTVSDITREQLINQQVDLSVHKAPGCSSMHSLSGTAAKTCSDLLQPCVIKRSPHSFICREKMQGAQAKRRRVIRQKGLTWLNFSCIASSSGKALRRLITYMQEYFPGRFLCNVSSEFLIFTSPGLRYFNAGLFLVCIHVNTLCSDLTIML